MKNTEIKLPFGKNENNTLVHVADVERGKKCGCFCPSCRTPLIAVKGVTNQHHFRHDVLKECDNGMESAIHMAAKQIIREKKSITLPKHGLIVSKIDSRGKVHTEQDTIAQDGVVLHFDSVQEEIELYGMKADILATIIDRQFIIEIFYRHKVEDQKREKITKAKISAIEINLSRLGPEDVKNWETFWSRINDTQNIEWLHYLEDADHTVKLEARLAIKIQMQEEEYRKESIEKQKKWQNEKEHFLQALEDVKHLCGKKNIAKAKQEAETHHVWKNYCNELQFSWHELPDFINANVPDGDWIFGCDRRIWQAALYRHFICRGGPFTIRTVDIWLQTIGCRIPESAKIVEKYTKEYPQLVTADILEDIPVSSSWKTLHAYFNYLCELGILEFCGGDWGNSCFKMLNKEPSAV